MKAHVLVLAFAASASAIVPACVPEYYLQREYIFAKGQVKITRRNLPDIVKDLRINLVHYGGKTDVPTKTVVVGTAKTDDSGFYAITGFAQIACFGGPRLFLELYDNTLALYPISKVEVPAQYVFHSGQPVKTFETNITAEYSPPPS
ncbi:hypothetical protein AAVH_28755 [Aphelenchoides avenae]|nr:hypothetical protein AAVH_28755 [Aphelenchus avenae]